tara:strand:- start:2540 stop:2695 length:156 start_codon:yes stop_codon:yes gene_type:complete
MGLSYPAVSADCIAFQTLAGVAGTDTSLARRSESSLTIAVLTASGDPVALT